MRPMAAMRSDSMSAASVELALGDIAGDLGDADDASRSVSRMGEMVSEILMQLAILAAAAGLEVFDAFAGGDLAEDLGLFGVKLRRNQDEDGLADDLVGQITEQRGWRRRSNW